MIMSAQELIDERPLALAHHGAVRGGVNGGPEYIACGDMRNGLFKELADAERMIRGKEQRAADHKEHRNAPPEKHAAAREQFERKRGHIKGCGVKRLRMQIYDAERCDNAQQIHINESAR